MEETTDAISRLALENTKYSRAETVSCVIDYYHFMVNMYLPGSVVKHPPPDGWPDITDTKIAAFGMDQEAAAVLRHLPYVVNQSTMPQCAPRTAFQDWDAFCGLLDDNPTSQDTMGKGGSESPDCWEQTPPHVVGLCGGGRDDGRFLLDTKLGIVHWNGCPSKMEEQHNTTLKIMREFVQDHVPDTEYDWRAKAPAWPVRMFFQLLKNEYRNLHFLPTHGPWQMNVYTTYAAERRPMVPMLQRIWEEHGWPGSRDFDKKKCLDAIKQACKEGGDAFDTERYEDDEETESDSEPDSESEDVSNPDD